MEISRRQKLALDMLLKHEGNATLNQIASHLGVSSRTIHRELSRIAPDLKQHYGLVLSSRSGQGLQVIGEPKQVQACLDDLKNPSQENTLPEERRRLVAAYLLNTKDVVKLYSLTNDLGLTTFQVRADLKLLHSWFALFQLNIVLRRGLGISLEGPENGRRQALVTLFIEHFGEAGILNLSKGEKTLDTIPKAAEKLIYEIISLDDFKTARVLLSALPRGLLPILASQDYQALMIHLAVSLSRNRQGLFLDEKSFQDLKKNGSSSSEFSIAQQIIIELKLPIRESLKALEVLALESFLKGAKPGEPTLLDTKTIGSMAEVQKLINACNHFSTFDFSDDRVLRDGLVAHWGPAYYRVLNHLPIRNPLLDQIKAQYTELFTLVAKAVTWTFPALTVPEDEIAYLVLHFGASLERRGKARIRFRALVVCSAGIGSANMLASRIRTELPEIDIVANLSWFDIKDISRDTWDILISTIPLPLSSEEYIMVNPLLTPQGISDIRACLERRRNKIRIEIKKLPQSHSLKEEGSLQDLKKMSRHLSGVIELLEHLKVFGESLTGFEAGGWNAFLAQAVERCSQVGLIQNPALAVRDLAERSSDRGIILPNSQILFLHTRSEGVRVCSLSIHVFKNSISDETGTWKVLPTRLVLMLAPSVIPKETQNILNEISVSFLDARTIEILHEAEEQNIRAHYTQYLDRFFRSFTSQGE